MNCLLRSGEIEAFFLHGEASAEWPVQRRRALWQRVAGCSREGDRRRAWMRLAALGAEA